MHQHDTSWWAARWLHGTRTVCPACKGFMNQQRVLVGKPTRCACCLQVQAHGAETGFGGAPALFFLPHPPLVRSVPEEEAAPPLFLLMKGRDWCCAGADHYEPLLAQKRVVAPGKALEPYIHLGD